MQSNSKSEGAEEGEDNLEDSFTNGLSRSVGVLNRNENAEK